VHAKSDAVMAVRPVLGRENVTLMVNAEVERLETSQDGGSVTGVVVSRDGEREVYAGDIVAVCAGAAAARGSAPVGVRPPSRRPGQRLGPGGPQLHVSQQQCRRRDRRTVGKDASWAA
jgi:2-polyprenyl-6-methoxyphenol hydroxylase-like FAD-dependent oxidoreductase